MRTLLHSQDFVAHGYVEPTNQVVEQALTNAKKDRKKDAKAHSISSKMALITVYFPENLDAPTKIYRPSTSKRKTYSLDHCQQVGKRVDKEVTKSMVV
jgi:hypothetical protein